MPESRVYGKVCDDTEAGAEADDSSSRMPRPSCCAVPTCRRALRRLLQLVVVCATGLVLRDLAWRSILRFRLPAFCAMEHSGSGPFDIFGKIRPTWEYYLEEACYLQWLQEHCRSLQDCPRRPTESCPTESCPTGDRLWERLSEVNRKNLVLMRMLYLFSFFAEKHGLEWALTAGSALGVVRGNAIIPHENDVDIWLNPAVGGGFDTLFSEFNEDFPRDLHLRRGWNRVWIQDMNSCLSPGNPSPRSDFHMEGMELDFFGYMTTYSDPREVEDERYKFFDVRQVPPYAGWAYLRQNYRGFSFSLEGAVAFTVPIANFTLSGWGRVGKSFPSWEPSDHQLQMNYGTRYWIYLGDSVKMGTADFSASLGCIKLSSLDTCHVVIGTGPKDNRKDIYMRTEASATASNCTWGLSWQSEAVPISGPYALTWGAIHYASSEFR